MSGPKDPEHEREVIVSWLRLQAARVEAASGRAKNREARDYLKGKSDAFSSAAAEIAAAEHWQ